MGGYLSSSFLAAVPFRLLRYGGFLEDIGAEVEVNPDDQYRFYQCMYMRHNVPSRLRDYHVTFPRVFPTGLWGVGYSLKTTKTEDTCFGLHLFSTP